jgi:hypothetical protein
LDVTGLDSLGVSKLLGYYERVDTAVFSCVNRIDRSSFFINHKTPTAMRIPTQFRSWEHSDSFPYAVRLVSISTLVSTRFREVAGLVTVQAMTIERVVFDLMYGRTTFTDTPKFSHPVRRWIWDAYAFYGDLVTMADEIESEVTDSGFQERLPEFAQALTNRWKSYRDGYSALMRRLETLKRSFLVVVDSRGLAGTTYTIWNGELNDLAKVNPKLREWVFRYRDEWAEAKTPDKERLIQMAPVFWESMTEPLEDAYYQRVLIGRAFRGILADTYNIRQAIWDNIAEMTEEQRERAMALLRSVWAFEQFLLSAEKTLLPDKSNFRKLVWTQMNFLQEFHELAL